MESIENKKSLDAIDLAVMKGFTNDWEDWESPPIKWLDTKSNRKAYKTMLYLLDDPPKSQTEYENWLPKVEKIVRDGCWSEKEVALDLCFRLETKYGRTLPPRMPDKIQRVVQEEKCNERLPRVNHSLADRR